MVSKAFKLAEAMVSNPVMSDMVENPTATPAQIAAVETKTAAISSSGVISAKNITTNNTLTQSFDSNQIIEFNLTDSINSVSPLVSVFKEVPVGGVSSKGNWDVNANATNYEFYNEKPISYSSSTLTPSATGDGTFTNSAAIVTPYMLSNLSYDSKSFDASTQLGNAEGIAFKSDGTAMYLIGFSNDKVWQYTLSTAYDISTASYSNKSFSVASQDGVPRDVRFKPDGTIMYVIASTAPDSVYQYTLSTAWDVSTASYANKSLNVQSQSSNPSALVLSPDGTKVYIGGYSNKTVFQYNLSTAWDLSTGSYSNNSFATTNDFNYSHSSLELNSDASKLFVARDGYEIAEYNMPSDGDVSNVSYVATYDVRNTTVGDKNIGGMAFANNGAKFYIFGNNDMHAYQFSSTASLAFNAADVGKKVVGNSGSAIITSTAGAYKSVTAFADTSAISSWQLFGAEGKSDGSGISLTASGAGGFDISAATYTGNTINIRTILDAIYNAGGWLGNPSDNIQGAYLKNDGTMFYAQWYDKYMYQVPLTTAYDISSATSSGGAKSNIAMTQVSSVGDVYFKPDGTRFYVTDWNYGSDSVSQYNLSTAWDITTMSYGGEQTFTNSYLRTPYSVFFSADGTKMYTTQTNWSTGNPWFISRVTLSTAWDVTTASQTPDTNQTYNLTNNVSGSVTIYGNGQISPDGTKIVLANRSQSNPQQFILLTMSTPYDLSTISVSEQTVAQNTGSNPTSVVTPDGLKVYMIGNSGTDTYEFDIGEAASVNYNSYSPALTNSSNGQINSSTWQDINLMTADETKNDGDIFYAVSTDNRTSWGVAKASDGVRKIARNNSGTWQYNNDAGTTVTVGFDISNASYDSKSFGVTGQEVNPRGLDISADGTVMIMIGNSQDDVFYYTLSTPFDVSTASYTGYINQPDTVPNDIRFGDSGTKIFICDNSGTYKVEVIPLSTAYDVSTAGSSTFSGNLNTLSSSANVGFHGMAFKTDGTKMYILDFNTDNVHEYSMSTAWDVSTLSYITAFSVASQEATGQAVDFSSDGTKMFVLGQQNDTVYQYNLSTAWDISTASYSNISFSIASQDGLPGGLCFGNNGQKMYMVGQANDTFYQYSTGSTTIGYGTSETWVNGTTNNEHATLQQALGAQSFNRMNKAQLDAVADGYHFSQDSADTLDLMIAPYAASGTSPISDGVTINYDAAALVREAVAGTDYIAEFPLPNKISIKSLISTNMKIRAQ